MPKKKKPPKTTAKFAARLKMVREHHFESAKAFAESVGIEAERYRTWERAEREPDITHLKVIAEALNVSLDFLILGQVPPAVSVPGPLAGPKFGPSMLNSAPRLPE